MDSLDMLNDPLAIPEIDEVETCPAPGPEAVLADERTTPTPEAPDAGEASEPTSLCVAFRGANGGAGVTSLAIETAHAFAQAKRGEVCLVDLDFSLGMCAHYLDLPIRPELGDFQTDPGRVDANYVRAMLTEHSAGFSVLGSPGMMGGNDAVNPACVLAVLDHVAERFPIVVMDVPRLSRPWTEAALRAADRTCIVTELSIPALHVTRERLKELQSWGVPNADVIVSKMERRSFKASIRIPDAERALGQEVLETIGLDIHSPLEAMNCGEPVGRIAGESAYAKDCARIARTLAPQLAERRRRRSPWGRFARGK